MENYFGKSRLMASNVITIQRKKTSHFTLQRKKKIRPFRNHKYTLLPPSSHFSKECSFACWASNEQNPLALGYQTQVFLCTPITWLPNENLYVVLFTSNTLDLLLVYMYNNYIIQGYCCSPWKEQTPDGQYNNAISLLYFFLHPESSCETKRCVQYSIAR